jgi:hypothetical protein
MRSRETPFVLLELLRVAFSGYVEQGGWTVVYSLLRSDRVARVLLFYGLLN